MPICSHDRGCIFRWRRGCTFQWQTTIGSRDYYLTIPQCKKLFTIKWLRDSASLRSLCSCWKQVLGKHRSKAVSMRSWCAHFNGMSMRDINDETNWFKKIFAGFIDENWRYVIDPANSNYVLDMRHVIFVGFHAGVTYGNMIEFSQTIAGNASGHDWQDYISNEIGNSFSTYFPKPSKYSSDWAESLCSFLKDSRFFRLRPTQNC